MKCCKDCTERYLGCHDHCEKFRADKAEDNRLKALAQEEMLYKRYAITRSYKRRDDDAIRKKRHSGYSRFKGRH